MLPNSCVKNQAIIPSITWHVIISYVNDFNMLRLFKPIAHFIFVHNLSWKKYVKIHVVWCIAVTPVAANISFVIKYVNTTNQIIPVTLQTKLFKNDSLFGTTLITPPFCSTPCLILQMIP